MRRQIWRRETAGHTFTTFTIFTATTFTTTTFTTTFTTFTTFTTDVPLCVYGAAEAVHRKLVQCMRTVLVCTALQRHLLVSIVYGA
jgi:hypothetical protein